MVRIIPEAAGPVFTRLAKIRLLLATIGAAAGMVVVFHLLYRRTGNPLRQVLLTVRDLAVEFDKRTRELTGINQELVDSIDYARRLQEATLVSPGEMAAGLDRYFILWQPRDKVGGDFYWLHKLDAERYLVAVIDCTGHGVPGALVTMMVNSTLNHIVERQNFSPAEIIAELNRRMKKTLRRNEQGHFTDDGLDIGLCLVENRQRLIFAGAKIPLYINRRNDIHVLKGDKQSIGYRRSRADLTFTNQVWPIEKGDAFYLLTDGYIDQCGGEKGYPLGRRKFIAALVEYGDRPLPEQKAVFDQILREYMGREAQRDDILMLGFSF